MAEPTRSNADDSAHKAERSATYREVFAVGEFRALFGAYLLSLVGDQLAKVGLSILVFERTGSAPLAALTFAVGYLPWLLGGTLLSALADRLPRRSVLIACDLLRGGLIGLMVIPGMPLWLLVLVLLIASLLTPPFEAARSALLPDLLEGDRYAVGISVSNMTSQLAQVGGFVAGGALVAVVGARGALAIDAATFVLSAGLIAVGLHRRAAPIADRERPRSLWSDTGDGLRFIAGNRELLILMLVLWVTAAFTFAPEGLAVPLAAELGADSTAAGLLLAANPLGLFVGGFVVGRLLRPARRERLMRPLAVLSVVTLIPVAFLPDLPVILVLYVVSGVGTAFMIPLNVRLIATVPVHLRGRTFGVANTALQSAQGIAVAAAGLGAEIAAPSTVVSASGMLGLVAVALLWRASPNHSTHAGGSAGGSARDRRPGPRLFRSRS